MAIGTITVGTVAEATADNPSITPAIVGSSDATSILLCLVVPRASTITAYAESGAGNWTEVYAITGARGGALYWAPGTETTAPTVDITGSPSPALGMTIRIPGAKTSAPIGNLGANYTSGSNDNTVGPIGAVGSPSDKGVVFCWGIQINTSNNPASNSAISANSSGSWTKLKEHFTAAGSDISFALFHNVYTSTPTLADETITFTGGTTGNGQSGRSFEILAEGDYVVAGGASSLTITEQAATLQKTSTMPGDAVALTLTPKAAGLLPGYLLPSAAVALTIIKPDQALVSGRVLSGAAAALTITPQAAVLTGPAMLPGEPVALTITPQDATLQLARYLGAGTANMRIGAWSVTFLHTLPRHLTFAIEPHHLTLTPMPAILAKSTFMTALGDELNITPGSATFIKGKLWQPTLTPSDTLWHDITNSPVIKMQ